MKNWAYLNITARVYQSPKEFVKRSPILNTFSLHFATTLPWNLSGNLICTSKFEVISWTLLPRWPMIVRWNLWAITQSIVIIDSYTTQRTASGQSFQRGRNKIQSRQVKLTKVKQLYTPNFQSYMKEAGIIDMWSSSHHASVVKLRQMLQLHHVEEALLLRHKYIKSTILPVVSKWVEIKCLHC